MTIQSMSRNQKLVCTGWGKQYFRMSWYFGYSAVIWPPQTMSKFCIQGFSRSRNSIKKIAGTDQLRFPRYSHSKSLNSHRHNVKNFLFFFMIKINSVLKLGKGGSDGSAR